MGYKKTEDSSLNEGEITSIEINKSKYCISITFIKYLLCIFSPN